ncbi:hypothetical protein GE21DRAFT_1346370 [Neurospora crassa]|nr:hypothetical protein GE21DRAFT_1346370 [Neurospora crassa]
MNFDRHWGLKARPANGELYTIYVPQDDLDISGGQGRDHPHRSVARPDLGPVQSSSEPHRGVLPSPNDFAGRVPWTLEHGICSYGGVRFVEVRRLFVSCSLRCSVAASDEDTARTPRPGKVGPRPCKSRRLGQVPRRRCSYNQRRIDKLTWHRSHTLDRVADAAALKELLGGSLVHYYTLFGNSPARKAASQFDSTSPDYQIHPPAGIVLRERGDEVAAIRVQGCRVTDKTDTWSKSAVSMLWGSPVLVQGARNPSETREQDRLTTNPGCIPLSRATWDTC